MPALLTGSKNYRPPRSPLARASQPSTSAAAPPPQPAAPDYSTLLSSDPVLQAALRATTARGVQQEADLAGARQRALIQYGAIPDPGILGGLGGDITDSTRQLAGQATEAGVSTTAQLRDAYKRQQSGDIGSLIGRNSLRSGDYKRLSRENLHGLQVGEANAQTSLLDTLAGFASTRADQQQQNVTGIQSAAGDALTRIVGQINAGTIGAGTSPAAAAATPSYGITSQATHPGVPSTLSGAATVKPPKTQLSQSRKRPLY